MQIWSTVLIVARRKLQMCDWVDAWFFLLWCVASAEVSINHHHRALSHFIVPINLIVLLLINHKLWVFLISGVCQCVFSLMSQWNDYQRKKRFAMEIKATKTPQEKCDSAYRLAETLFAHTLSQTAVLKPYDIGRLDTPIEWLELILYTLIKQSHSFA